MDTFSIISQISPTLDLAMEAHELLQGAVGVEVPGVKQEETTTEHSKTTTITILNKQGEKAIKKPQGKYITIEAPQIRNQKDIINEISDVLACQLQGLLPDNNKETVLVIGLGNHHATPDSLGPAVTDYIKATRHLMDQIEDPLNSVCTLCPGVLGITGIETAEIIKGVVSYVHPCCIIAIDALAATSIKRIGTTIQLTDTGINPGSGVGNNRDPLNLATMGVPVIAIGVPTVVHTGIIIYETIETLCQYITSNYLAYADILDHILTDNCLDEILNKITQPFHGSLIVTPKEIDQLTLNISQIIAIGITKAIHPHVDNSNYNLYLE